MIKKIQTSKLLLAILTAILVVTSSCIQLKQVSVDKIESIEIEEISLSSAQLKIILSINNPNIYKITVEELNLKIFIEDTEVGVVNEIKNFEIPANTTSTISTNLSIDFSNIFGKAFKIIKLFSQSDAKIKLRGTIVTKILLINHTFQVNEEDVVSIFKK